MEHFGRIAADVPAGSNIRDRSRIAAGRIRRYVEEGIATHRLKAGDKLPTERELSQLFMTGRNTVRRILVTLEDEGKVIRHVGRGTFVVGAGEATETTPATPPVLPDFTLASIARMASPLDLMEFRLTVEPDIAAFCVHRASPAEIEKMQTTIDVSLVATAFQEFENVDDLFHRTICVATRNPLFITIADIITTVRANAEWSRVKLPTIEERRNQHMAEHLAILDAIRERNEKGARQAMEFHLRQVKKIMFG